MPRATVDTTDVKHVDLKTCPGGFVELRKMSYGEVLTRRAMVGKMRVEAGKSKDFAGEMALMNEQATQFEYAHCIVDHNLEDATGRKLNLANPTDLAQLDPRVGAEIDKHIMEMNQFEDEEDAGES